MKVGKVLHNVQIQEFKVDLVAKKNINLKITGIQKFLAEKQDSKTILH